MNAFTEARVALGAFFPHVDVAAVEVRNIGVASTTGKLHLLSGSTTFCGSRAPVAPVSMTLDEQRLDGLCKSCERSLIASAHIPVHLAHAAQFVARDGDPQREPWPNRLWQIVKSGDPDMAAWAERALAWQPAQPLPNTRAPRDRFKEFDRHNITALVLIEQLLPNGACTDRERAILQQLVRCSCVRKPYDLNGPGTSELAQAADGARRRYERLYEELWGGDREPRLMAVVPGRPTGLDRPDGGPAVESVVLNANIARAHETHVQRGRDLLVVSTALRIDELTALVIAEDRQYAGQSFVDLGPGGDELVDAMESILPVPGVFDPWSGEEFSVEDARAAADAARAATS